MKVSIIVPVYNEVETVIPVINKIFQISLDKQIVVVDDGSTDGTAERLKTVINKIDILITHNRNEGKGSAIRSAIPKLTGQIILIQDADLELDPNQYEQIV